MRTKRDPNRTDCDVARMVSGESNRGQMKMLVPQIEVWAEARLQCPFTMGCPAPIAQLDRAALLSEARSTRFQLIGGKPRSGG